MTSLVSLAPAPSPSRVRPSSTTRDSAAHLFAETKLANANVRVFATDVLMEGELDKKGEGGLQTWKNVRHSG
ncbi:hypothetical protein PINS_up016958 [Pythium insidiosum]|nr:hypothetical protein PINS_up016958 [Pythium insidiosum]